MSSLIDNSYNKHTYCLDSFSFRILRHVNPNCGNKSEEELISQVKSRKIYNPFRTRFNPGEKRYFLRICPYGADCKGAHSKEEIVLEDKHKRFLKYNMKDLDIVKYYNIMLSLINKNKKSVFIDLNKFEFRKLLVEKDISLDKDRISNLDSNNFLDVLHLWRDIAYIYGVISKNLVRRWKGKGKPPPSCGYSYVREVPKLSFGIPIEEEDLMWSMNKYTRECGIHKKVLSNLHNKVKFSIKECCGGDINCKFGSHYVNEMVCTDDLITGQCNCENKTIFNDIKKVKIKIKELQNNISNEKDTKKISNLNSQLQDNKSKLVKLNKDVLDVKIHLTEKGLVPFTEQIEKFKSEQKKVEVSNPSSIANLIGNYKKTSVKKIVKTIKKNKKSK